jgi:Fe-S-cluster containining protein
MEKKKISFNQQSFGSIFKLIKYIGHLTKEPIVVEVEGVEQAYNPPERVVISNLFFRNLKCLSCGRCCTKPKFSLVYTESDYTRILAQPIDDEQELKNREILLQDMVTVPVQIDLGGIFHHTSVHLFSNQGHKCHFLFEKDKKQLCGIHQVHPNHCALPHLQIDQHKGVSTSLLKRQYGRNWALGCPAIMEPFNYDAFLNWDLPCLRKLENNAKDLRINTWLPEIIKYLTDNREQFKTKQPKNAVVIYDKKKGIPHSFLVKD